MNQPKTVPIGWIEREYLRLIDLAQKSIGKHDFADAHAMFQHAAGLHRVLSEFSDDLPALTNHLTVVSQAFRSVSGVSVEKVADRVF